MTMVQDVTLILGSRLSVHHTGVKIHFLWAWWNYFCFYNSADFILKLGVNSIWYLHLIQDLQIFNISEYCNHSVNISDLNSKICNLIIHAKLAAHWRRRLKLFWWSFIDHNKKLNFNKSFLPINQMVSFKTQSKDNMNSRSLYPISPKLKKIIEVWNW